VRLFVSDVHHDGRPDGPFDRTTRPKDRTMSTRQLAPTTDLLATLIDRIVGLGIATEVSLATLHGTGAMRLTTASHAGATRLTQLQVARSEGPSHDCCSTGRSVSTPDLTQADGRWPTFTRAALAAGFRSIHAVPVHRDGTVLGALSLFLTAPGGISPGGLRVVAAMADIVSIGLEQQRELDRAHDVESQLQQALVSRISIEQAKGIISEQAHVTTDAAFALLRRHARDHNLQLSAVAVGVTSRRITAADLGTPSEPDARDEGQERRHRWAQDGSTSATMLAGRTITNHSRASGPPQ
jgi:GAF domain-containing protein